MKRMGFILLLVLSISGASVNAFAAQMKYSFVFHVDAWSQLNGNPLNEDDVITVDLYGNTDDVELDVGWDERLLDLSADVSISSLGTYSLLEPLYIVVGNAQSDFNLILIGTDYGTIVGAYFDWPDVATLLSPVTVNATNRFLAGGYNWSTSGGSLYIADVILPAVFSSNVVPIPNAMFLLSPSLALLIGLRKKHRKT